MNEYRNKKICNEINILDDYAELIIKSPKYGNIKALIDIEDINHIKNIKWNLNFEKTGGGHFYIMGKNKETNKTVQLHRLVTNCPDGLVVDHLNHNSLDNRKQNLKCCTQKINSNNRNPNFINTTNKYVYKVIQSNKYIYYRLIINRKQIYSSKNIDEVLLKRKEIFGF